MDKYKSIPMAWSIVFAVYEVRLSLGIIHPQRILEPVIQEVNVGKETYEWTILEVCDQAKRVWMLLYDIYKEKKYWIAIQYNLLQTYYIAISYNTIQYHMIYYNTI